MIESAGPHRSVELGRGLFQCGRIELKLARKLGDGGGFDRRKQRRHEAVARTGVENDVGDLVGLGCHQPPPDRVAFRPDVLALVVEALGVLVDDDAEHHGIMPRDDAAVEFGSARVDRDRVTLRGIADFLNALLEQHLQDRAAIVGCAADQEIVGGLAPILLEPFDVGLKTAGGCNKRRSGDGGAAIALLQGGRQKHAVGDFQIEDFRVVEDLDAKLLGGQIKRVQHRPAAAQEE